MVWNSYTPGKGNGPIGVRCPPELGGNAKTGKGGNMSQAVALKLLERLPKRLYHLWMDNLFTSTRFLEVLAERGYGGTGTARTSSGVLQALIEFKKSDSNDTLEWGTKMSLFTESGKVCQSAWKDNAVVLIMSNCLDAEEAIERLRRRPKLTSSKAKTSRKPFGDMARKALKIPIIFNEYNFNMGAVDEHDNMASRNAGLRPIRRGGHQALDHWLLRVALVNSYLLSLLDGEDRAEREVDFRSQKDFRQQLVTALLYRSLHGPPAPKRRISIISTICENISAKDHELVKRSGRKQCVCTLQGNEDGGSPTKTGRIGSTCTQFEEAKLRNQYLLVL